MLLCITSPCLSPHGPHTACSECDERQWMIDARRASTHLLCSSGGVFEGCPAPLRGAGVWEAAVGTRRGNSATLKLSFHQHYIIPGPFSPTTSNGPEARPVYREGQWMGSAGLLVAPEPGLLVVVLSGTCELKNLNPNKCIINHCAVFLHQVNL